MPMSRKIGAAIVILCALALSAPAGAEDLRTVRSGEAIFHFNVHLLNELGLDLVQVKTDATEPDGLFMEEPHWAFNIHDGSDLRFRTEYGIVLPNGFAGGTVLLDGQIVLRDFASGRESQITGLQITQLASADQPENRGTPPLYLKSAGGEVFCELVDSMFEFLSNDDGLNVHYLNARISDSWAKTMGRPDLAGWFIGMGELRTQTELLASAPPSAPPYTPNFDQGFLDVSLGALSSIQTVGHDGVYPTGAVALSMSTTSCNLGSVDVPWLAPMQKDHPVIHMALYRLMNGVLEQVGISWMKHGFYALSNSQCTPCQHPSGGQFLGVGCSDTYGVGNNSDRNYLGPREEVNAYLGTWECKGSHFAGGIQDCVRRHGPSGHGILDHRLVSADADLNNAGATYYYEAYYVVRGEENLWNNWGSRFCTMSWNGSTWVFSTPSNNNPLVEGPALARWGDLATYVNPDNDGRVLVNVKTTDLGGGTFHYEYALLNMESDREVRSFSLPVQGVPNITNISFHDGDTDPNNDWTVTVENGTITWQTSTYDQDPDAHALEFGYMFNFRFDADAGADNLTAHLGLFKPGSDGGDLPAATRGPINITSGVAPSNAPAEPRLLAIHPNPLTRSTSIDFELAATAAVKLDIYDAAGRLVRALVDEGQPAGAHSVVWDGKGQNGDRVHSGVYYARLRSGSAIAVKSMVVVN